jgi:hypothetical protein
MSGSLTCRNGHTWRPALTPPLLPEDRCPRCAAPTRSPDLPGSAPWVILGLFEVNLLSAGTACLLFWDRQGALVPLAAAAALWGVAGWLVARAARARRMEAVCGALGFTFTAELSSARLSALGGFHVLGLGRSRTAYHMMEGRREGCAVALLELRYDLPDGADPPSPRTVVVVANSLALPPPGRELARHFRPGRPAAGAIQEAVPGAAPAAAGADGPVGGPPFRLEPTRPGDWLWRRLGWRGRAFLGHAGFAKRYWVVGPCGEAVRRALLPEVLDCFAAHPGWHVEYLAGRLLAHRRGPCDPAACPARIAEVVRMYRALRSAGAAPAQTSPPPPEAPHEPTPDHLGPAGAGPVRPGREGGG